MSEEEQELSVKTRPHLCREHNLFTRKVGVHESAQAERHKAFILVSSCRLGLRRPGGVDLFEPSRDAGAQKDLHLSACLDLSAEGAHMDFIPDSAWTHECLCFFVHWDWWKSDGYLGLMQIRWRSLSVSICPSSGWVSRPVDWLCSLSQGE